MSVRISVFSVADPDRMADTIELSRVPVPGESVFDITETFPGHLSYVVVRVTHCFSQHGIEAMIWVSPPAASTSTDEPKPING